MRRALAVAAVAALAAGCGTKTVTRTVTVQEAAQTGTPRQIVQFGTIESLARKGRFYVLRFDPAWFLGGVTANAAAVGDGAIRPGESVPNDYYIVDEGHRLLTYLVPPNAHVTVLTRQPKPTRISVVELARIVNGGKHRPLFEPLSSGVWIRVRIDTVLSLDQQYRP